MWRLNSTYWFSGKALKKHFYSFEDSFTVCDSPTEWPWKHILEGHQTQSLLLDVHNTLFYYENKPPTSTAHNYILYTVAMNVKERNAWGHISFQFKDVHQSNCVYGVPFPFTHPLWIT